jgi:uncharacterized membrane protein
MQEKTTPTSVQTEQTPQPAHSHHFTSALFHHQPHLHQPRNVNQLHEAEKAAAGFNQRVAVGMTQVFQSMITFWVILTWIVSWILLNFLPLAWDRMPWPLLLCLASVPQLPLMIVIMVGQGLLGRKQELQADEQFHTTMSTYHDIEEIMKHLAAQDAELLRHAHMLMHLLEKNGISLQQLATEGATTSYLSAFVQPQPVGGDSATPVLAEGEKPTT